VRKTKCNKGGKQPKQERQQNDKEYNKNQRKVSWANKCPHKDPTDEKD
jgi:hypothetical protein